jgi:hypothetical protein
LVSPPEVIEPEPEPDKFEAMMLVSSPEVIKISPRELMLEEIRLTFIFNFKIL